MDPLLKLNHSLTELVSRFKDEDVHVSLPSATDLSLSSFFQLLENGSIECDITLSKLVINHIYLFGGSIVRGKASIKVESSSTRLSGFILTAASKCLACQAKLLWNTADQNDNTDNEECECNSLRISNEKLGQCDRFVTSHAASQVDPITTDSVVAELNGSVTIDEIMNPCKEIPRTLSSKAILKDQYRLRLLTDMKEGKKPLISAHNISRIFNVIPTIGKSSREPHLCLICKSVLRNRCYFFRYLQQKHTAVSIKCDNCHKKFCDEWSY